MIIFKSLKNDVETDLLRRFSLLEKRICTFLKSEFFRIIIHIFCSVIFFFVQLQSEFQNSLSSINYSTSPVDGRLPDCSFCSLMFFFIGIFLNVSKIKLKNIQNSVKNNSINISTNYQSLYLL